MENVDFNQRISGDWSGENILHDPMTNTKKISPTTFRNTLILKSTFLELNYDWTYENSIQEGTLVLGRNASTGTCFATWVDTWHMSTDFMLMKGKQIDNRIELFGEYDVEGFPRWGWKTTIQVEENTMKITMLNISPEKEEYPAIDIALQKR